jgi:hypothetical protein
MAVIQIEKDYEVWVDEVDYAWARNRDWKMIPTGRGGRPYERLSYTHNAKGCKFGTCMSRLIAERIYGPIPKTVFVDHRNRIPFDNRRCNLRLATRELNNRNKTVSKSKKGGLPLGIFLGRIPDTYRVRVKVNGKQIHIGMFRSITVAMEVRQLLADKLDLREEAIALERVRLHQETLKRKE